MAANNRKGWKVLTPELNPYTPGAGRRPTALAGRQIEQDSFSTTLRRLRNGPGASCLLVIGLRGVGKTVLLNRFARLALDQDWIVADHEFDSRTDLVATIATLARQALLEMAPPSTWQKAGKRTARALHGLKATYSLAGLTVSIGGSEAAEPGVADSGDLSRDLTDLLVSLGEAARDRGTGVVLLFDELQFAQIEPLGALVAALHKVGQRELPLTLVGAGLPQLRGVLAEARSYSERLFSVIEVGPLSQDAAYEALVTPAVQAGADYDKDAVSAVLTFTEGYPYFLQAYGDHLWQEAAGPTFSLADVQRTEKTVRQALDNGFFRFRTDRLTPRQRRYLRAMAEHGSGEVSSGDVAATLGMTSSAPAGRVRDELIQKGLIYSPRLGRAAFTVPQFDDYLRRHFELEQHAPAQKNPLS